MSSRKTLAGLVSALLCVALSPVATANAQAQIDPLVARTLELTNAERQRNGVAPLTFNPELGQAAQAYSVAMATSGCFAHTCGPVSNMAERANNAGYTGWSVLAENIAFGYPTPEAVLEGWINSAGHRDNLLSPRFTEIGIGVAQDGSRPSRFWTQNFGTRPGVVLAPMISVPDPAQPEDVAAEVEAALDLEPESL